MDYENDSNRPEVTIRMNKKPINNVLFFIVDNINPFLKYRG